MAKTKTPTIAAIEKKLKQQGFKKSDGEPSITNKKQINYRNILLEQKATSVSVNEPKG